MLKSPMHPWEQAKGFEEMCQDDKHQTSCAEELQEGKHGSSSPKHDDGTREKHTDRKRSEEYPSKRNIHAFASRGLRSALQSARGAAYGRVRSNIKSASTSGK